MKARILPILNSIGCLALTGLVVSQWCKERNYLHEKLVLESAVTAAKDRLENETKHSAALGRDIVALKETIEITRKSTEESTRILAEQNNRSGNLETELTAAREQVKTWEASIAARDAKLRNLNADLTATRARLDEAIAKLKSAGAR